MKAARDRKEEFYDLAREEDKKFRLGKFSIVLGFENSVEETISCLSSCTSWSFQANTESCSVR